LRQAISTQLSSPLAPLWLLFRHVVHVPAALMLPGSHSAVLVCQAGNQRRGSSLIQGEPIDALQSITVQGYVIGFFLNLKAPVTPGRL
jgi:hypothetical protein